MNIVKKLITGICLGMMMLTAGCGGNDSSKPAVAQGQVVKGPVVGAKVYDSLGVLVGTTDQNGNFPLTGTGPYTTVGGTYRPLKADGTAGAPIDAPPMKAPIGVSQITPLSTLYQTAIENNNVAAKTAIETLLTKAGVTLSTNMSAKPLSSAANSSGIDAILTLNESLGAALQQSSTANAETRAAVTTALTSAVTNLSEKSVQEITTAPETIVSTTIANSITTAAESNTALAALSSQITTAVNTAANGTANLKPGSSLPINTGSTSNGTTLGKQ